MRECGNKDISLLFLMLEKYLVTKLSLLEFLGLRVETDERGIKK